MCPCLTVMDTVRDEVPDVFMQDDGVLQRAICLSWVSGEDGGSGCQQLFAHGHIEDAVKPVGLNANNPIRARDLRQGASEGLERSSVMLLRASSRNYESGSCSVAVPEMKHSYLPVHKVRQTWVVKTWLRIAFKITQDLYIVSYWSVLELQQCMGCFCR